MFRAYAFTFSGSAASGEEDALCRDNPFAPRPRSTRGTGIAPGDPLNLRSSTRGAPQRKGHNVAGVAVKKTESVIAESLGLGALSRELRRSHREPDRELTRFETRVKKIVEAPGFDALVGFVLLANATAIAVEQQHTSRNTHAALFSVLDILFLAFFTVELSLRYVHVGGSLKHFSNWMWFDVTVVFVGFVTDVILPHFVFRDASKGGSEEDSSSAINDSMNALKALRCMRLVRMFSMVEHLWTLALTFLFSAKPLFWTVVFLMIVLFVFAVFLAALCVEEHPPSSTVPAQTAAPPTTSCATFTGSFLALLRIMTFDDWIRTILELTTQTQKPALMVCFFGIFVATASLALMNLVTAVVFDSASRRAAEEQAVKQNHFEYQLVAHKAHVDELQALLEQHHVYTKARKRQLFNILRKGSCCASLERALDHLGLTTEEEVVGVLLPLLDPEQTGCIERNLLLKAMLVLEQVGYNAQAAALVQSVAGVEGKRYFLYHAMKHEDGSLPLAAPGGASTDSYSCRRGGDQITGERIDTCARIDQGPRARANRHSHCSSDDARSAEAHGAADQLPRILDDKESEGQRPLGGACVPKHGREQVTDGNDVTLLEEGSPPDDLSVQMSLPTDCELVGVLEPEQVNDL